MTLLTTQEERDGLVLRNMRWRSEKNPALAGELFFEDKLAIDCNTLIGLLREARGYVEHLAWGGTSAPAADLLSRIDKEIGNG